jgi:hypothetical protein
MIRKKGLGNSCFTDRDGKRETYSWFFETAAFANLAESRNKVPMLMTSLASKLHSLMCTATRKLHHDPMSLFVMSATKQPHLKFQTQLSKVDTTPLTNF